MPSKHVSSRHLDLKDLGQSVMLRPGVSRNPLREASFSRPESNSCERPETEAQMLRRCARLAKSQQTRPAIARSGSGDLATQALRPAVTRRSDAVSKLRAAIFSKAKNQTLEDRETEAQMLRRVARLERSQQTRPAIARGGSGDHEFESATFSRLSKNS